jgi:hypothetical protein
MRSPFYSSLLCVSLLSLSVASVAAPKHGHGGPFKAIKANTKAISENAEAIVVNSAAVSGNVVAISDNSEAVSELVDVVSELASSLQEDDVVDISEYHFFDNNYDRHFVDQNGNNAPGQCDQRLMKTRWDGVVTSHSMVNTNSVSGAQCGYELTLNYLPAADGKGLYTNKISVLEVPGLSLDYSPGYQLLKQQTRIGESWGELQTISNVYNGSVLSSEIVLRTSTMLSRLDSIAVPAGTFTDCVIVSTREEIAAAEGGVNLRMLEAITLCRDVGAVRRVGLSSGYDYQLVSYGEAQ